MERIDMWVAFRNHPKQAVRLGMKKNLTRVIREIFCSSMVAVA